MEIFAWCEKLSTCSGQWTSPPIGDSRWNNFGSCGNWMEPEGRNSGNTFMNFRNGQRQIYQIKDLWSFNYCSENSYFKDIMIGFCYLYSFIFFVSGLIFWGFLEIWMPWSFLTRLEMTIELKIELWSLMTKSRKI